MKQEEEGGGEEEEDEEEEAAAEEEEEEEEGGGGGGEEEEEEEEKNIKVTVKSYEEGDATFLVKRSTKFMKILNEYCKKVGVDLGTYYLTLDGERIQPEDTPNSLDLKDDGAVLDAVLEQTGGGCSSDDHYRIQTRVSELEKMLKKALERIIQLEKRVGKNVDTAADSHLKQKQAFDFPQSQSGSKKRYRPSSGSSEKEDVVEIMIQSFTYGNCVLRCKIHTRFEKIFDACIKRFGLEAERHNLRFLFDGMRIDDQKTPYCYGFEPQPECYIIDCFQFQMQDVRSQLLFSTCDFSTSDDLWVFSSSSNQVSLFSSNGTQCISLNSGCCFGEDVRGGDLVVLDSCNTNDDKQRFSWPSASFQPAPNALVSIASGGGVSPSVNGNVFVVDAAGSSIPGTAAQLRAFRNVITSGFTVNGSSTGGARLIHTGSGLCLKKGGNRAQVGPTLSLATCSDNKQIAGSTYQGSQLFTVPAQSGNPGIISDQRGYCLTASHAYGADNTVSGEVRLVGATCNSNNAPSQLFSFTSNGTLVASIFSPSGLVADSNGGNWQGAPISLLPNSGSDSSVFTLNTTNGGSGGLSGSLVHKATGLCLDTSAVPSGHGCLHPSVRNLPFCDPTSTIETRVADLVSRLTLSEMIGFLGAGEFEEPCGTYQPSIARLDIPVARQLIEVTSMASGVGLSNGKFPTAFASGLLLGGSFNRSVWLNHGIIIGKEMRAQSNIAVDSNPGSNSFNTLSGHGPDINQPRDPRNGRIGELISEDPYLTAIAAEKVVRGMQFGKDVDPSEYSGPLVMLSSLKHYNAYSLETNRFGSKGNVSMFDLFDSYLPQYERPMTRAAAAGTMCSYFSMRIEGSENDAYIPSCSDSYILTDVIRTYWKRPDATHLTDCGAVWNQAQPESSGGNGYVSNLTLAAAASVNAGCDMNSNTITPTQLPLAIELGLVTPSTVSDTAARILAQRFRVGQFDPLELPSQQQVLSLGVADIGTDESRAIAAEGVLQSLVLIKNEQKTLPLVPGKRVALLGPQGSSFDALKGDCYCSGFCTEGSDCFPSLQTAIETVNSGGQTITLAGVSMLKNDSSWTSALAAVANSDVVILALGTDTSVAAEGTDRQDGIGLPGLQAQFGVAVLQAAKAANVPVILLLLHNLPVSFDELVLPANATYKPVDAIVDAWAPMTYANEVAQALFGKSNRWGRATMTIYPKAYAQAISLFEYSMTKSPGRSYKYYDASSVGEPLIKFGNGLSFSIFNSTCSGAFKVGAPSISISCSVSNINGPDGDEVLMIFHRPSADIINRVNNAHPLPLQALVEFERVSVSAGGLEMVNFNIPVEALGFINEDGATTLYPGTHYLDVCNGNTGNVTIAIVFETVKGGNERLIVRAPPKRV